MKNIIIILMLLFSSQLAAQSNGFLKSEGKNIVDPDGNNVLLKGIGLGNWLVPEGYMFKFKTTNSPLKIDRMLRELIGPAETNKFWKEFRNNYIQSEDIKFLKKSGFNSVRVPFSFRLFALEEYPDIELEEGFVYLDKVINWCKEENLYVILDMHCAPGGQTGDNIDDSYAYPFLFVDDESRQLTIKIWKRIASRYKDETIIAGYDLINEPIAHYFETEKLNPGLQPFYEELIQEIRKIDSNHIVFIGGAQWNSNFDPFTEPFDNNSVYTFHKYWTEPTQDVIESYILFRDKYNVPIWMGESGENDNEWINKFRTVLERNNIGWAFWPYKKIESGAGVLSIKMPDNWELIQNFAESSRVSYEEIRTIRPEREKSIKILTDLLNNITFKNCTVNSDYINSLGLNIQ